MPVDQQRRLSAMLGAVVLGMALPHMLGHWYTVAALVLLPAFVSAACAMRQQQAGLLGTACLALMALPVLQASLPVSGWLAVTLGVWLAANALYAIVPDRLQGLRTPVYWACACMAAAFTALVQLAAHYQGDIITGIADSLAAAVNALPMLKRPQVLVTLYQLGLARLSSEDAELLRATVQVGGVLGVSPEAQQELLLSFRTTVIGLLPSLLSETLVKWGMLTAFAATLVREALLRHRTGTGQLLRMEEWHLPRGSGRMMLAFMLAGTIPLFTDHAGMIVMASMCLALAFTAFELQGLMTVWWWARIQRGLNGKYPVLFAVGAVVLPYVLFTLGLYDQLADPRSMRTKDDGDNKDDET